MAADHRTVYLITTIMLFVVDPSIRNPQRLILFVKRLERHQAATHMLVFTTISVWKRERDANDCVSLEGGVGRMEL